MDSEKVSDFFLDKKVLKRETTQIEIREFKDIYPKYRDYLTPSDILKLVENGKNKVYVSNTILKHRKGKQVEEWLTSFLIRSFDLKEHKIAGRLKEIDDAIDKEAREMIKK